MLNLRVNLKLGTQLWQSSIINKQLKSSRWEQSHTFDISDSQVLVISLTHIPLFLSPDEIGSCTLKLPYEHTKVTEWYELIKDGQISAKILISFIIDEKLDPWTFHQNVNNLELERAQIWFYKAKYLKKINELKETKQVFRKNSGKFLNTINEAFKDNEEYLQITENREKIKEEIKYFTNMYKGIKNQLAMVCVGNAKKNSIGGLPRRAFRVTSNPLFNW